MQTEPRMSQVSSKAAFPSSRNLMQHPAVNAKAYSSSSVRSFALLFVRLMFSCTATRESSLAS